jgi:HlyD family type I secretion membrane fusion protein
MTAATSPIAVTSEDKAILVAELFAPTDELLRVLGIFIAAAVAVFVVWGTAVPIASGVVAQGTVGVENHRKTVQHLEGGIVRTILVRDGSHVRAGDIVLRLDDTETKLSVSVLQAQVDALRAEQAARHAELARADEITFPADLLNRQNEPDVAVILKTQRTAFAARRTNVHGRKSQLHEQLAQLNKEIAGNRAQSQSRSEQIDLLDSEINDVQGLFKRGLTTRTRLLALQRAEAQSRGDRGALDSEVAKLKAQQSEVSIASMQIERQSDTDASDVLRQVEAQLVEALDKLAAAKAAQARTEVRAPVSGTVVGLAVTTVGGVIRPGEALMDIVPSIDKLVVNAKVDPKDADAIRIGQPVSVRFDGAGTRYAPVVQGAVEKMSADSLIDQRSGHGYFQLMVVVADSQLKQLPTHLQRPGLPADVLIETGSRSAFGYMFAPITRAGFSAMRER